MNSANAVLFLYFSFNESDKYKQPKLVPCMKFISLSFEVQPFESNKFNFEFENITPFEHIIFTENFSENDASLFISSLLTFNDLSFNDEFITMLNVKDELALPGGLVFNNDKSILYPSCCAEFQDWSNNICEIKQKNSPWMGHDPTPYIEFLNTSFLVLSDEDKETSFSIPFTLDELVKFEKEIKLAFLQN